MTETSSDAILLLEMGASCLGGPPIWASGEAALEDEAACFVFGIIATVKSVSQMKENGESSKLFITLNTKLGEEKEESNDDSWKTVVFYRHSDLQRYAARVSRPNPRPTRGMRLKWTQISRVKGKMSLQLCQTCDNAPRTRDSRLTKLHPSKGRVSSARSKLRLVNRVRAASSLQRSRPFRGCISSAK